MSISETCAKPLWCLSTLLCCCGFMCGLCRQQMLSSIFSPTAMTRALCSSATVVDSTKKRKYHRWFSGDTHLWGRTRRCIACAAEVTDVSSPAWPLHILFCYSTMPSSILANWHRSWITKSILTSSVSAFALHNKHTHDRRPSTCPPSGSLHVHDVRSWMASPNNVPSNIHITHTPDAMAIFTFTTEFIREIRAWIHN